MTYCTCRLVCSLDTKVPDACRCHGKVVTSHMPMPPYLSKCISTTNTKFGRIGHPVRHLMKPRQIYHPYYGKSWLDAVGSLQVGEPPQTTCAKCAAVSSCFSCQADIRLARTPECGPAAGSPGRRYVLKRRPKARKIVSLSRRRIHLAVDFAEFYSQARSS